jgi:predicted GNAT family acetyltransferase
MDVRDNRAEQRFELTVDGAIAIAAYERDDDAIVFTHTVVPEALRGEGVGSRLIAGALAQVREQGLKVVPQCPFVAAYLRDHPDAATLA